jgi:hypothetical protein
MSNDPTNFGPDDTSDHLKLKNDPVNNDPDGGSHLPTMPDPGHDPERGQKFPTDPDPTKKPTRIDDPPPVDEDETGGAPGKVA